MTDDREERYIQQLRETAHAWLEAESAFDRATVAGAPTAERIELAKVAAAARDVHLKLARTREPVES